MDDQEKYYELENIETTLNSLIEETTDKYYIDQFKSILNEIQEEKEDLENSLRRKRDLENIELNNSYERSQF